uniref:Uncharacterized protein n=1 Tax=Helianthus annuus TaxID=4232 RepID=A0A251S753_HELAN
MSFFPSELPKGFCSECMCPVCLNFDCANNTCSWVGCDVCSHWCHAACSIQKNLIKPGPSLKGPTGTTEMQFNCPCCDHASEMFGFIKDVFRSCAEQWGLETLIKELNCVRKIFRGSEDFKGQKLHLMAGELISKLENKVMSTSDVCITILQFFNSVDAGLIPDVPILNPSLKDPIPPSKPHQTSLYNTGSSSGRADDNSLKALNTNKMVIEDEWSVKPSKKDAFDTRMKMDMQSGDSRGKGSENTKGVESLDFGRSRKLSRPERILREIVSESVQTMAQITQELPDETFESTKEYLKKLITLPEKRDELVGLQLRLLRRSDLTSETLSKANRNQLVLLVSIRMGLDSFLSVRNPIPTNELIEIFLLERCKNVNCKRLLPVEDCDCKICSTKKGFCSECMCPVCLNFDCASNTCSWVGCDVCSHWCHAACGIQKNLIKPGPSLKGPTGTTEMQFNCPCCDHASEMFGFIKDVFRSCAEQWGLETLIKELNCVRKIFRGSGDFKGQKLHLMAGELISKLENKVMSPSDVCVTILQFFNSIDAGLIPDFPISNPSLKDPIPPSKPHQTSLYNTGSSSGRADDNSLKALNTNKMVIEDEWSVKPSKKDAFDSVESLVRIKEAEARMFQNKADEARREAEGYTRMIRTKIEKLDEEYTVKIAKVNLHESEEERKKKAEEVKVSENDHCEYYKMKMRMQAEIAGLLERMEKTKQQWVV